MSNSEDDDYIPSVLETVRNDLELGEIVDVHQMQSWTDDADQIELARAYLAEQLKLGLVVRISGHEKVLVVRPLDKHRPPQQARRAAGSNQSLHR